MQRKIKTIVLECLENDRISEYPARSSNFFFSILQLKPTPFLNDYMINYAK